MKQIPFLQDRKRLVFVFIFLVSLFSILIAQFYKIQIVEGDKWKKVALKQHNMVVIEPAKRGVFYSNTAIKTAHPDSPKAFVVDVPKFHLYADPLMIPSIYHQEISHKLNSFVGLKDKEFLKLKEQFEKKTRSRRLLLWLDQEVEQKINAWWIPYAKSKKLPRNALFFIQDYKRSYPYDKLLGQVLHTIREERDPVTHQNIPTGGLELMFNSYLEGKEGRRIVMRSPRHALDTGKIVSMPENGADVFLTINHTLQAIAEEEMAKAVHNAGAKAGWAIMMEPKTGEILAFAQYPEFNLSSCKSYFNNKALEENTKVKALTDPYEPGSIMKPITIAIALRANKELKAQGKPPLFSPHEKIACAPCSFPGRNKILKDLRPHKFLNMYMAIQKSSNVYPAKLVQRIIERLGDNWYREALKDFGFGVKTNIELPGESAGLLPTPGKKNPNGTLEWSKSSPYSLAMGHNILANGLQMVRMYGILANGGYDVQPTLIRKIVRKNREGKEEVLLDHTNRLQPKRILDPDILDEVIKSVRFTARLGGTAAKAAIDGYTVAGKTGSSEKVINGVYSKKNHISTFVGFVPINNPQFVLLVVIDEPEWKYTPGVGKNHLGGGCCAPPFKEIGRRSLQYLGTPPDDPDKKIWKEEVEALKKLYDEWN